MIPCLFAPINLPKGCLLLQRSLLLAASFDFLPFSPMESFTLLKFWKPSTASARVAECGDSVCYNVAADDCLVPAEEEEEESFFELEFTLPGNDRRRECKDEQIDGKIGRIGDFISDEKADVRFGAKPQSPISILKQSAPKLRVLMFGNLTKKLKPEKSSQNQSVSDADSKSPKRKTKINFTVKLRIEDAAFMKKSLTRSESSRSAERRSSDGAGDKDLDGSSRRFSKDSVQKYLNLIKKPLYVKLSSAASSKPSSDPFDSASTTSFTSPRKSGEKANSNSRFRVSCKNLGKSRSASALLVGVPSAKDDSLAQQNDGIQGAILHCKQSFNSSFKATNPNFNCANSDRVMSRSVSDTSCEKSNQTTV